LEAYFFFIAYIYCGPEEASKMQTKPKAQTKLRNENPLRFTKS
tara:strand:+ start:384 stop:512 length:129 start_codon:yes stop_codon:yes gene_type:complete